MNISKRVVGALLLVAIVLFLGMVFWPFVLRDILQPVGLAVWLLLRILVLSIPQNYFWYAVIFAAFIVLFRLLPEAQSDTPSAARAESNSTMTKIDYWRSVFRYSGQDAQDEKILKDRLTRLLISLYTSKQSTSNDFRIHTALEQGTIRLPGKIHTFLFAEKPQASGGPLRKFFQSLRTAPQTWIRHWNGQEKAEYDQRIEEVLNFLETSLEIKHDDGKRSQTRH
ncbi:MAG TPA: hypothetical protein VHO49_17560 [Anaerolineales bacterium]|nr:hypothetical protein [Anaerolineales bacterium]